MKPDLEFRMNEYEMTLHSNPFTPGINAFFGQMVSDMRRLMVAVLAVPEWLDGYCAFCGQHYDKGHKDDCPRQAALFGNPD